MSWKFVDDFDQIERDIEQLAENSTQKSAKRAVSRAQVPVKTGHLRDSRYVQPAQSINGHSATVVGYDADYAAEVHDGHMNPNGRFVGARPFLTNALNADEQNLEDDVANGLLKFGCIRVDRY
ncbi:HK97 gp10 family phage protein [bacterium]|nr:MAG: HK97 gp10 family phage protein [bacterium]